MKKTFILFSIFAAAFLHAQTILDSAGLAAFTTGTTSTPPPTADLLWLKLNNNTTDSSAAGDNGTASGSPTFVTGQDGITTHALSFVGSSSQLVQMASGSDFNATASFTLTCWFKVSGSTGNFPGMLVKSLNNISTGYGLLFRDDLHTCYFQIADASVGIVNVSGGSTFNDGAWHLAVGVCDRTAQTITLYVDGVSQGSTSCSSVGSLVNTSPLYLATRKDTTTFNYFTGSLDDARIYSTALTSAQVTAIFGAGAQ